MLNSTSDLEKGKVKSGVVFQGNENEIWIFPLNC